MRIKTYLFFLLALFFVLTACERREVKITTSSPVALELYKEGVTFAEKFYEKEAIEKFNKAIEIDTSFAMAYYYLSRVYNSAGNLTDARKNLKQASKYSGVTTPLEWMYIGAWEKNLEIDYSSAISIYKDILKDYSNDRHTLHVMGRTLRLMKDYPNAVKTLKLLIDTNPGYAPAYNQLGYVYKEMGKFKDAMKAYNKYAKLEPDQANPYDSMGDMYRAKGQYLKAINEYQKALKVKPDFYTSHRNLGLSYYEAGEYDEAIKTYKKLSKLTSDYELKRDIHSDLINIYIALGQYDDALEHTQRVIELARSNFRKSWAVAIKGYIYYLQNNYSEAMKQLNASLTILPEAIWSREWRGMVFLKENKFDMSLAEADKMKMQIDKYGIKGYQSNYHSLLGKIALEQGLYDEAIMYFEDAMKFDIFINRYSLAVAYFHKGDYKESIELCQQIFDYNRNYALAHLLLAKVYAKQGNNKLSTTEYNKFKNIWKNADLHALETVVPKWLKIR